MHYILTVKLLVANCYNFFDRFVFNAKLFLYKEIQNSYFSIKEKYKNLRFMLDTLKRKGIRNKKEPHFSKRKSQVHEHIQNIVRRARIHKTS